MGFLASSYTCKKVLQRASGLIVLCGLCTFSAPTAYGKSLEKEWWHKIQSPNFTMYSLLDVEKSKNIMRDLETLRVVIPELTDIKTDTFSVPIEIVVVRSGKDLSRFSSYDYETGTSLSNPRRIRIIARESNFEPVQNTILNEYVHLALSRNGPKTFPNWVVTGFAQYFETAKTVDNRFQIGGIPENLQDITRNCTTEKYRGSSAKRLSLSNFVGADLMMGGKKLGERLSYRPQWPTCNFWFESWSMIHYLMSLDDKDDRLEKYRSNLESGQTLEGAVANTLGASSEEFQTAVRDYVTQERLPFRTIGTSAYSSSIEIKSELMKKEHISLVLAQIATAMDRQRNALRWFKIAKQDKSIKAEAESGTGVALILRNKLRKALPHFQKAIELAPNNANVQLDMGYYWSTLARRETNEELRNEYWRTARKHYGAAWKLDDTLPEIYVRYGYSLYMQEKYQEALDTLETAHTLFPFSFSIRVSLADAYLFLGRPDDALEHARTVSIWDTAGSPRQLKAKKQLSAVTALRQKKEEPKE